MLLGTDALIALVLSAPIVLWAAWSDLATMKIPNKSVLALWVVFLVAGPFLLDWHSYFWGIGIALITLTVGFFLSLFMVYAPGDVKMASGILPFCVGAPLEPLFLLMLACTLGALVVFLTFKFVPPLRRIVDHWESWKAGRAIPFGLALAAFHITYLANATMAGWNS